MITVSRNVKVSTISGEHHLFPAGCRFAVLASRFDGDAVLTPDFSEFPAGPMIAEVQRANGSWEQMALVVDSREFHLRGGWKSLRLLSVLGPSFPAVVTVAVGDEDDNIGSGHGFAINPESAWMPQAGGVAGMFCTGGTNTKKWAANVQFPVIIGAMDSSYNLRTLLCDASGNMLTAQAPGTGGATNGAGKAIQVDNAIQTPLISGAQVMQDRQEILIQNLGPDAIYVGFTNQVTTATGRKIFDSGGDLTLRVARNVSVFAIAENAAQVAPADTRVIELN